jgi:putative ABC transport system permease protein
LALPIIYNIESVRARWRTTIVAVLGIAGTVAVFVAMLALATGFKAALVSAGSPENAMIRRAGATSELDSAITLEQLRAVEDAAEVRSTDAGPLVSPEVVVVAALPMKATGTDANVQMRGVSAKALLVHQNVRIAQGRFFAPASFDIVVGKNAQASYSGLDIGSTIKQAGATWTVVGVMDSAGSAFDSEIWCDSGLLNSTYQRPAGIYQSLAVRLMSEDAFTPFKSRLAADPRTQLQVERETDYYSKASQMMTNLILGLGSLVAAVMGLGAVFGALNTMYSAVAERSREVATLRALGFGGAAIVLGFVVEALLIATAGGLLGCLIVLPINGITTGAMNFQTFSHLAFAFQVTAPLLAVGLGFALVMGLMGGVPPAVRAARLPVTEALRDL